jgi:hypothetical protein
MTGEDFEADGFDLERWKEAMPYRRVGTPTLDSHPGPQAVTLFEGRDDVGELVEKPAKSRSFSGPYRRLAIQKTTAGIMDSQLIHS